MPIPGLTFRVTKSGLGVVRLHYTADPDKRPGTYNGDKWIKGALSAYPGGMKSPRWRKEMEIDYGALGGTKLFPDLAEWINLGKIVIPSFNPDGYKLYGSYDHGWRNPSAYHVHGVDYDGNIVTLWEFYGNRVPVNQISKIIKGQDVMLSDGRHFTGNPYAGQEIQKIADPSIWAEDKPMDNGEMKNTAFLFEREGVFFEPGERGGDITVGEWIHGHFWRDPLNPHWRITNLCPKLIWELGGLRHKDLSPRVALNRDQPEGLIDKDNHAFDGIKMFFKLFPPPNIKQKALDKPASFNWWKKQAQNAKEGKPIATFRREMVG